MCWTVYRFLCIVWRCKNSSPRSKSIKSIVSGSSESSALILLEGMNSNVIGVLSSCLQTSSRVSSSSSFFNEDIESLEKPFLVRWPQFVTGNVRDVTAMLSTSSSNNDSPKEYEENSSNLSHYQKIFSWRVLALAAISEMWFTFEFCKFTEPDIIQYLLHGMYVL